MIRVREAIEPGSIIVEYHEDGCLEDCVIMTEAEARELYNELYKYFDKLDRDALARQLTRGI